MTSRHPMPRMLATKATKRQWPQSIRKIEVHRLVLCVETITGKLYEYGLMTREAYEISQWSPSLHRLVKQARADIRRKGYRRRSWLRTLYLTLLWHAGRRPMG